MPKTYEYSFGSVRAKEKYLFSNSDIQAMLSLGSIDALIDFLRDKGYGDGDTVDEIIRSNREQTRAYLCSIMPDMSVFDVFLYKNDAHNIKSVIKGLLSNTDYGKLFIPECTVDTKLIETAVKENKFSLLPEGLSEAGKKAYETLAHTADARKADAFIDGACMKMQLEKAKETGISFLIDYVRTELFYINVKIALRACLTSSPKEYYEDALIDGIDFFNKQEVIKQALKGYESLIEYLSKINAYRCNQAMEVFSSSPAEFEKFTENLLIKTARDCCKKCSSGPEAAIGFYIARLFEEKAIHIIAVGIDTASGTDLIRERLREVYG